jgi:VWFA-related protein
MVRIDAIAADRRGVVRTLTARDVDVRDEGKPVQLDEMQFVTGAPRLVAIYLDEYHISAGPGADRARRALIDLVDSSLGARDSIVVMKPLDSVLTIRLHDREEARRIIGGLEGRKGDYTPRNDYERSHMADVPERIEAARNQLAVSALNALSVHLGTLGQLRKTLLVVTEGLDSLPRRRGQEYLATVESIVRSANRSNVSIYPIDPRPATTASPPEAAVLQSLAENTAGTVVRGAGEADDLSEAVRQAVADGDGYYMLTYRSAHEEDGAFHPIEVRSKKAGVTIRTRSGYWAPDANDRLAADLLASANRPPRPVRLEPARRTSPLIQPWFGLSPAGNGKTRVTFVWEPSPAVPGAATAVIAARVEVTVLGEDDSVLFEGAVRPTGPGRSSAADAEPARAVFDTKPGRLRVRMKVQDAGLRDIDTDVRDMAIRDLRGPVSLGTPQLFRARNAREFRLIADDPAAPPVSSREFSRTERLLVRVSVSASEGPLPAVSARLLNRMGQPMRTLEVAAQRGIHQIDLSLAGLAPGEYHVEVAARTGSDEIRERVTFRVTS